MADLRKLGKGVTGALAQAKQLAAAKKEANLQKFIEPSKAKERLYHGTGQGDISAFNLPPRKKVPPGYMWGQKGDETYNRGVFLSPDPEMANHFAKRGTKLAEDDAGQYAVYPVRAQIERPFDYENPEHREMLAQFFQKQYDEWHKGNPEAKRMPDVSMEHLLDNPGINFQAIESPEMLHAIEKLGFDSFYTSEGKAKNIGVFDPRKIKSDIGNRGTYDITDPDINKAKGGVLHMADAGKVTKGIVGALTKATEMAKAEKAVPKVDRLSMSYKDVTKRVPEVADALEQLLKGDITKAQYNDIVNTYKPVTPYSFVPKPATKDEAVGALRGDAAKERYGKQAEYTPGSKIGLRLDIPAYTGKGVWVNSIHDEKAKKVAYGPVASVKNADLGISQAESKRIAQGGAKAPYARIKGEWNPISEEEAIAKAQEYLDHPEWRQIGMDPERHSYFYDRRTMQPITNAEEIIQIGPLVLGKNPKYANIDEFDYATGGKVRHMADAGRVSRGVTGALTKAKQMAQAKKSANADQPGVHYADPLKPPTMRMSEALGNAGAEGKTLNFTEADRSRVFGPNRGGVGFSGLQHYSLPHKQANTVWGFGKKSVAEKKIRQNDPDNTLFTTFVGSPDQHKSNSVVIGDAMKNFQDAVRKGVVPPEQIMLMNKRLNEITDPKTGAKIFEDGFDLTDPAALSVADTFTRRAAVGDVMLGLGVKGPMTRVDFKKEFPNTKFVDGSNIENILRRETDPDLVDAGTYDVGNRFFVMDGKIIERPDLNEAFPIQVTGTDLGMKYELVPPKTAMRDFYKEREGRKNKRGEPSPVTYYDLARAEPSQFVDEDYLTFLQKEGYKKGGTVNRQESPEDMARFQKRFAMHKAIGGRVKKMAGGGRVSIFDAPVNQKANGGAMRMPPKKTEGFEEEAPKSKSIFDTVRQAVRQVPKVATSPLGVGLNAGYAGYKYLTGEDPLEDLRRKLDAKLNPPINTGSEPVQQFEKFAEGGNVLKGNILAGASWNSLNKTLGNELTTLTGQPTLNTSVGGATTADTYKQLMDFINGGGSFDPNATVFLQTGGVDFITGVPREEVKNNIEQIISVLDQQGVNVVLTGAPYAASMDDVINNNFDPRIDPLFEEIAAAHPNVALVDSMGDILQDKSLLSDSLHTNETGTRRYNDDVIGALTALQQRGSQGQEGREAATSAPQEVEAQRPINIPDPAEIAEEKGLEDSDVILTDTALDDSDPAETDTASIDSDVAEAIANLDSKEQEIAITEPSDNMDDYQPPQQVPIAPDYSRAYEALGGADVVSGLRDQLLGMGIDESIIADAFSKYYPNEYQPEFAQEQYKRGGAVGRESPADMARFNKRFAMHKAIGGAVKKPQKFDGGGIASPEESSASDGKETYAGLLTEFLAKAAKDQGKEELSSLSKPRAATDLLNRGVLANNPVSAIIDMVNMGLIPLDVLGSALTGRNIKVSSDKPFLGSEHLKDLMKEYNITSGEERPMMETALSFASPAAMIKGAQKTADLAKKAPEALNTVRGGLETMSADAQRPFRSATLTMEGVAPDLGQKGGDKFKDLITKRMISGEGAPVSMERMGGRKTEKTLGQGLYENFAKQLETNPMVGITIPRAGNLSTNKRLIADIGTAGQELGQEMVAAHKFTPLLFKNPKDATAMMIGGSEPLTKDQIRDIYKLLPGMIVTHSPKNNSMFIAPFEGDALDYKKAAQAANEILGKGAKVQFGKADSTKDIMYRGDYKEMEARPPSTESTEMRNRLKKAEARIVRGPPVSQSGRQSPPSTLTSTVR